MSVVTTYYFLILSGGEIMEICIFSQERKNDSVLAVNRVDDRWYVGNRVERRVRLNGWFA